ncbi:MAG TPA: L,D-transpeptidase/peptidoglycan binding protein [Solirubrobacteraceae bacterium]|jgi:lipoprotein-anchoring transpeptidase ErfK/SrfK|nr:L,D-transpeptidase/peptidoglycan binding protein [Solirubrobacteraceae bacterium]
MTRARLALALVIVLVPAAAFATLAFADRQGEEKIAEGVRVEGVDVGGLTTGEALGRVHARLRPSATRPVRVRVDGERFTLSARTAGMTLGLKDAIERAYEAGRGGNLVTRGWRSLTGGEVDHDERTEVKVDRDRVRAFVNHVHANVSRAPVDAQLTLQVDRVAVSEAKAGRRLADREALARRVTAALLDPRADRTLRARTEVIDPEVTQEDVWDRTPVVVTVSRAAKTARVFRRGELVRSYRVAVGEPRYPTPMGSFSVQGKQVDPPWNVPDSEWAGKLAGQTIPGGDPRNPLKARWIGFNGSVGFHGTSSVGSLGTAASHGCVRMSEADVIDLYERVEVGTPVLVGA